jgi:hypothetical protein
VLVTLVTAAPLFIAGCVAASGHVLFVPTPTNLTGVEKHDWEMQFRQRTRRLGRWLALGSVVVVAVAVLGIALA